MSSGFSTPSPELGILMVDVWGGHEVWEEVDGGKEKQTSTPAFVASLLSDRDAAYLISVWFTGKHVRTHNVHASLTPEMGYMYS